ncbi:aspartate-semialdehyde dehydrogenase [Micromonospora sp. HUAS LYJ1]|uniref:aspartate-semialdehyde dehydrogenase n=1 Tax=Micromonospora sp. HUAS LYJ1 TaxID=3061626 RepID=UPI0026717528|nr:aspartate-semialdehyde dehydrogenase [Micromonospora sp. HUAS LYJ1]WKU03008.1 aspartate-semialdehyde dehydrogenase [Micromonospora sp. HUAS LYJ1]
MTSSTDTPALLQTDLRAVTGTALPIAVVGATGAVGRTLIDLLVQRGFPVGECVPVASARSAGQRIDVPGGTATVHDLDRYDFSGVRLAFFSAGTGVSERHARRAAAQGALVIDNTNAFRMAVDVPLVVPQVNPDVLDQRPDSGIIANPNCSTIPLVRLLAPLRQRYGLRRVTVSTYQAASGRGNRGMAELRAQAAAATDDPTRTGPVEAFGIPLAYNVIPLIDTLLGDGFTLEEQKMRQESRKILRDPTLDVTATCVRVPVLNGHSETVVVDCDAPVDDGELAALLAGEPEVRVWADRPPTPRTLDDPDLVHVGRVRVDPEHPNRVAFWLVADNLRIGAALNAVQIAEVLVARGVR